MARKFYSNQQRRIVRIQCLWRVKKAREVYRELRREARNVDNIKKLNHGLENKIMELKRKLDEKSELFKAAELKLVRAEENGAITDDKINEIVEQLGTVAAERDVVIEQSNQKDKTIEVLYLESCPCSIFDVLGINGTNICASKSSKIGRRKSRPI